MKTLVRYSTVLVGALLSLASVTSPAQVATTSAQSGTGGQPPDSVVQIAADSQDLTPVPAAQIPDLGSGTFWVFDGQAAMPMPFLPPQCDPASTPVYSFGFNSEYLVDLTGGRVSQPTARQTSVNTSAALLVQGQLNDVLSVIALVQQEQANAALNATPGGAMLAAAQGSAQLQAASAAMFNSAGSISPTGLFLQITNVSAAAVSADLYNASDQVYAIWSTTNLATPFGEWQVETEVWPTNTTIYRPTVNPIGPNGPFGAALSSWMLSLEDGPMNFDVTVNSKYPGSFGLTQLVNMYSQTILLPPDVLMGSTTFGSFNLDGGEYHDGPKDITQTCRINDSPGQYALLFTASYNGNWKDYARFTPTGGIPVTLGRIDWNWAATAINPDPLIGWYITSDGVNGPTLYSDDSFPLWECDGMFSF